MRTRAKTRRAAWLFGLIGLSFLGITTQVARAQVAPKDFFTEPVLIRNGSGHHAPVRSMVFATPDGSQLLTGGMDKMIQVWNLNVDRSGSARTLRPPNWRGSRGQIFAMALSPIVGEGNQRTLAVAGAGVLGDQGEILLFRYPGLNPQGTGDIEAQIPATAANGTLGAGHTSTVMSLAFTPDGRFLASASNDRTVRIWEVATRRQVALLNQAQGEVNALAIFANGTRLVAGGNDGFLRLYDITNRVQPRFIAQAPPNILNNNGIPDPLSAMILTLAASPDDRWIVYGTEGGQVLRFDALRPLDPVVPLPPRVDPNDRHGPVEALAMSRDGRFATSIIAQNLRASADLPTVASLVRIQSLPNGDILETMPQTTNLVHALAFSPDNKRLAYSGGDAQSIYVKDFDPAFPLPDEIKGQGASIWDVGFRPDGQAIRFARTRLAGAGQPDQYEYFNLRGRNFFNPDANEPAYRHAAASEAGWEIRPVDQYRFDFINAQRQVTGQVSLDPINERRWWAYTVIPPGPGHPQPVAAVAADNGIVLWNLTTRVKTRFFNGHAGPIYTLASSPDGKWLVTGSSDQTVRLWPLAGCDRIPAFGARFERQPNGEWVVVEVTTGGFADGFGLKKGHVIEKFFIGDYDAAVEIPARLLGQYLPVLDNDSPTRMFTFHARMEGVGELFKGASTKRNSPALTLFPDLDRRWVLWTPRGYYDSSADGDRKFLGWLTNQGKVERLLAGTFDSIDKFEAKYRQPKAPNPNALDRLLDTGDPLQADVAVALVNPPVPIPEPKTSLMPVLTITPADPPIGPAPPAITDRPIPVATPALLVKYNAVAAAAGIRQLWVEVNGKRSPNLLPGGLPSPAASGTYPVPIGPEREGRILLGAEDVLGVVRTQPLDISKVAPPATPPRKSRLEIVAIGAETFADKRLGRIRYAEQDARSLTKFLGENLVDPSTGVRFGKDQVHPHSFLNEKVTSANLTVTLQELKTEAAINQIGPGDVIVVVIESYYLKLNSRPMLATTEPDPGQGELASIPADELANLLGDLTRLGCRAIVLVDAVHKVNPPDWETDIQEWVRQLQSNSKVVTFIASDHGPSLDKGNGHRNFADAVRTVLDAKSASRLRKPGGPMSLFDFQRTVTDNVLETTKRLQHAQCYLPDSISYQVPILDTSPVPR